MFCYQKNFYNPTMPVDEAQFMALVRGTAWAELIDRFRATGDASLKRKLPAFIFQATFDETTSKTGRLGRWRKQAATRLTGLVVMDIDHVEEARATWERIEKERLSADPELRARILLVYVTPSGKGLKIVFKARTDWGNLIDNQHRMAALLGLVVDESCKDASRMSFICKEEDILLLDRELFSYENREFAEKYTEQYKEGKTKATHPNLTPDPYLTPDPSLTSPQRGGVVTNAGRAQGGHQNDSQADAQAVHSTLPLEGERGGGLGSAFSWHTFSIQSIIDARYADKLPCAADSNRHNESLKLAFDLLVLFDGDKQQVLEVLKAQSWVQEIIHERNENVAQTVQSAAERMAEREKKYLTQLPSKAMQEAILKVTGKTYLEIINPAAQSVHSAPSLTGRAGGESESSSQQSVQTTPSLIGRAGGESGSSSLEGERGGGLLYYWGEQIETLFPDFPLLKDICKGLKRNQYPAAMFVAGGLLMTLMTRCSYRFYHRPEELRRLNNCTLIIGDPASGKSFATRLYRLLTAPIVEADQEGKDAINAYRELIRTKGANKEKPKKPKVVVRIHPARTSNAQFIQDMVNAVEIVDGEPMHLHMLTFDTELDNTIGVQKGGAWIDKNSMSLKAFHNEEDGQAYSNTDSILENFNVFWNFIYTGTPIALKKMVNQQNFGSGLATRLTCIPLPPTNFEMMDFEEEVDTESDARLSRWARLLDKTKGELSLSKIVRELYDWTARRMMDAKDNESRADEMLLKRCAYHGLNFAAPFIVMRHWDAMRQEGDYWCGTFETDETDWRLAELIVNIQYACQRHFFGAMAEQYFEDQTKEANATVCRKPKTIEAFNQLPEEFTVDDVIRCFRLNTASARVRVQRLMKDHLIEKVGEIKENGTTKAQYRKSNVIMT